ncbi:MAG: energy-coupling factor transporter ATPase [Erysipelotrichaceae bacterium]|nr:energy-coupling factor transporter ATPase [Erysipelotrichaceae bacterium]
MIHARDVTYFYNETEDNAALKSLNIDIESGQFVVIIGHNGSGKSTFAKLCNGIMHPTDGVILIDGMDTRRNDQIWEIRKTAGMVFQNPDNQIVATIVEEDVAFGPENLGVPSSEIRIRVDEALESVGMSEHKRKPPHLLSGGQKQRVAIAGILAMKPKCIILDEPTAMLDPAGRREVMETIHRLNRDEGITIVHITHFMDEAVHSDRVIVLEEGSKLIEGTPKEVFSQVEKLQDMGLDVPQVTLLAHMLREEGVDISEDIITVEELVEALCQLL